MYSFCTYRDTTKFEQIRQKEIGEDEFNEIKVLVNNFDKYLALNSWMKNVKESIDISHEIASISKENLHIDHKLLDQCYEILTLTNKVPYIVKYILDNFDLRDDIAEQLNYLNISFTESKGYILLEENDYNIGQNSSVEWKRMILNELSKPKSDVNDSVILVLSNNHCLDPDQNEFLVMSNVWKGFLTIIKELLNLILHDVVDEDYFQKYYDTFAGLKISDNGLYLTVGIHSDYTNFLKNSTSCNLFEFSNFIIEYDLSIDVGKSYDTNAVYSIRGWEFQVLAGIFILINNIDKFDSIQIESESDIQLFDKSGKLIIAAEAKSSVDMETREHNHHKKANEQLLQKIFFNPLNYVYISNLNFPFANYDYVSTGNGYDYYASLTGRRKEQVEKWFPHIYEKVVISYLKYEGNDDEKRRPLTYELQRFFTENNVNTLSSKSVLFIKKWQEQLFNNATNSDRKAKVTKTEMVWVMIAEYLIRNPNYESVVEYIGERIDENYYKEFVEPVYDSFVNQVALDFTIINEVYNHFDRENHSATIDSIRDFISKYWEYYSSKLESFFEIGDKLGLEMNTKMVLYSVLSKKSYSSMIKEVMKYED